MKTEVLGPASPTLTRGHSYVVLLADSFGACCPCLFVYSTLMLLLDCSVFGISADIHLWKVNIQLCLIPCPYHTCMYTSHPHIRPTKRQRPPSLFMLLLELCKHCPQWSHGAFWDCLSSLSQVFIPHQS